MDNSNPVIYDTKSSEYFRSLREGSAETEYDDSVRDPFDNLEIFDIIRNINDPEHPLTLEQLNVVRLDHITVEDGTESTESGNLSVAVEFTPTIPHCSMATLIGLCIRVKLLRSLPVRAKVHVQIRKGTHQSEEAINKQLNDKERVAAAMENKSLLEVVEQCLRETSVN
ncbi:hypothetical protein MP638_005024 [Amoeboaphelidium occidentale]|nr:hypothetical protein MP638_005024 [Amoeboaphelidium occidentale]